MPTARFSSRIAAPAQTVFDSYIHPDLLARISMPLLQLRFQGPTPRRWEQGSFSKVKLFLFGVVPLGVHEIRFVSLDTTALTYVTEEKCAHVQYWRHEHRVEALSATECISETTIIFETDRLWVRKFIHILYPYRNFRWNQHFKKLSSSR